MTQEQMDQKTIDSLKIFIKNNAINIDKDFVADTCLKNKLGFS